jgi:hypothetical protein
MEDRNLLGSLSTIRDDFQQPLAPVSYSNVL